MKKSILAVFSILLFSVAQAQTPGTTTVLVAPTVSAKANVLYLAVGQEDTCFTTDVDPETYEISIVPAASFEIIDLYYKNEIPNSKFVDGCEYQMVKLKIKNNKGSENTVVITPKEGSQIKAQETYVIECQTFSEGIACGSKSKIFDIQQ